jgi:hypothetical protein
MVVYQTHPATFAHYLKKKRKFAFWRVLAVRKNPGQDVKAFMVSSTAVALVIASRGRVGRDLGGLPACVN